MDNERIQLKRKAKQREFQILSNNLTLGMICCVRENSLSSLTLGFQRIGGQVNLIGFNLGIYEEKHSKEPYKTSDYHHGYGATWTMDLEGLKTEEQVSFSFTNAKLRPGNWYYIKPMLDNDFSVLFEGTTVKIDCDLLEELY